MGISKDDKKSGFFIKWGVVLLGILLISYSCFISLANKLRHHRDYFVETNNPTDVEKSIFIESFMPFVDTSDVINLSYIREGGREAIHVAIAQLTNEGIEKIRANTESDGIVEGCDCFSYFSIFKGNRLPKMIRDVNWWTWNETSSYEEHHWRHSDHAATYCIDVDNNLCYMISLVN